jgi:retinol dehydrogenase-12
MLPHLIKTGTPERASRLVIVSSMAHYHIADSPKGADEWSSIIGTINDEAHCTSRQVSLASFPTAIITCSSVMKDRYNLSKRELMEHMHYYTYYTVMRSPPTDVRP